MNIIKEIIQDAEIVDFGIYKSRDEFSLMDYNSPSGTILAGGTIKLVEQTEKIPAKIGLKFGFRFSLSEELQKRQLKTVYHFPEIKNPETGKATARFESGGLAYMDGDVTFALYAFTDPWELVPGEWTFQVFDGDRMLVEKKFTVVKAD